MELLYLRAKVVRLQEQTHKGRTNNELSFPPFLQVLVPEGSHSSTFSDHPKWVNSLRDDVESVKVKVFEMLGKKPDDAK